MTVNFVGTPGSLAQVVIGCLGSASMMVVAVDSAKADARSSALVVFPLPPLELANTITGMSLPQCFCIWYSMVWYLMVAYVNFAK